ncbi:MAG: isopenicillin N synthase family oxygenase [Proteobacteria bacterium]|nr:isopenicillin N synthase family oxygenase [Pseudomonadota bacterium]
MSIQSVDFYSRDASQSFLESLKNSGFVVIKNHPIAENLIYDTYKQWGDFFSKQSKDKEKYLFTKDKQAGFFPLSIAETAKGYKIKDIKEFFHYYIWGPCPDDTKKNTLLLYNALLEVAKSLLFWLEKELPKDITKDFSMSLSSMIENSDLSVLRIIHYPALTKNEEKGAVRAAPHEDINLLTVLPAATASGLQVLDTKNNWYEAPCDPGSLIVNTGDMLSLLTKHFLKATTHRVVNPIDDSANISRYSMPLFLHPRGEVLLTKQGYTAESFLNERLRELGLKE